jgi:hypothetical protein
LPLLLPAYSPIATDMVSLIGQRGKPHFCRSLPYSLSGFVGSCPPLPIRSVASSSQRSPKARKGVGAAAGSQNDARAGRLKISKCDTDTAGTTYPLPLDFPYFACSSSKLVTPRLSAN